MNRFIFYNTPLKGLMIVEPQVSISDDAYSMITYNNEFADYVLHIDGTKCSYVQENESKSKKGVLRGIHTQLYHPQGKLVRVAFGEIYDVVVDVRKDSSTFGEWYGIILSNANRKMLLIPEGFLHGFLVLSSEAIFQYKCTRVYEPKDEIGVIWNDTQIGINWPIDSIGLPIISEKDKKNISFKKYCNIILST